MKLNQLLLSFCMIFMYCGCSQYPNVEKIYNDLEHKHFYVSDVCDWQGSKSLNLDSDRSVMPIYLRCSRGAIKWFYPTGGMRVVLKLGTNNKDFRGCIRVARNTSRNVRIYIEGKRQLFQIFSADDGKHPDLFRCFVSVNHFIALFIETDSNSIYPHDAVIFQYNLQEMTPFSSFIDDYLQDCKPCSDKQILKLFCSTDFALSGKISYYQERPELDLTEFLVKPFYIHRMPINNTFINDLDLSSSSNIEYKNSTDLGLISPFILNRHLECRSNASSHQYLFLGKFILGKYFITCSPKLEYWKRISQRAILDGTNQCHMS